MKLKETGQGRRAAGGRKDGANSKLPRLERTTVGKGAEKVGKETPPAGSLAAIVRERGER